MNIFHPTHRSSEHRAFTLIELLVVITIIAVLAGLLLPVVQKVTQNAYKASTKTTESNIIAAVNAYQTEYGQYPVIPANPAADTTFGISGGGTNTDNKVLFNVLRALNSNDATTASLNSRQIVYFESKNVKNTTNPKDGFIATGTPTGNPNATNPVTLTIGDLVDPWGNQYNVRIDSGYTNAVQNPYYNATATSNDSPTDSSDPTSSAFKNILRTGVIAWSWGYDGIEASKSVSLTAPFSPTPGDDVDSWQ